MTIQLNPEKKIEESFKVLQALLQKYGVDTSLDEQKINFCAKQQALTFLLAGENFDFSKTSCNFISLDNLITEPGKIAAIILSKLNLNKKVFARNCETKKIDKNTTESFLKACHLMGATQSGSNRGLFYKNELLAVASFSKGRKMNRLPVDKRSFELIRFCSRPGITVTGGLTKLVKNFYSDKSAGDIMTYVDKQLSDGQSFINAGFKKHSETAPHYFLIHKKTFERFLIKDRLQDFDKKVFYLAQNSGSIKMTYQPIEKL